VALEAGSRDEAVILCLEDEMEAEEEEGKAKQELLLNFRKSFY
jgi:hypothetical protein